MAIVEELLKYVSVRDLLDGEYELRIPDFQRPYTWTPRIAAQLFNDVFDAWRDGKSLYILGTLILLRRGDADYLEVVDGQQRLVTLHLLRWILMEGKCPPEFRGNAPICLVAQELARHVADFPGGGAELTQREEVEEFRTFLEECTRVLQVVTDNEDEAFQFFDSQNFRGKALRPHDLLKAFHLREMEGESIHAKRAVVDQWERAGENDLNTLFSTYLVRIHRWSRNQPTGDFTMDDIDIFKGVGKANRSPVASYHRAAKIVLPGMQEWADPSPGEAEAADLRRARHQLDAPVVAGKPFFEFATFMLDEVRRLRAELYVSVREGESPDREWNKYRDLPRYRFCSELLVAGALYYANKFSDAEMKRKRHHLFRWAYAIRLGYERLGWQAVDNYALGRDTKLNGLNNVNLFAVMRDLMNPHDVPLEDLRAPEGPVSRHPDDATLAELMESGEY